MAQDTQMLIRIDANLKQLLAEVAANEDRSMAWIVRKALHNFVSARPEQARLQLRLVDPDAPPPTTYHRPVGRPSKPDQKWLGEWNAKPIGAYLDQVEQDRVTREEIIDNALKIPADKVTVGHFALVGNVASALGWIELVERLPDGSEQTLLFRSDPRKV